MKEDLSFLIDWELNQHSFRRQVREMTKQAQERGKVIPLPFVLYPGQPSLDLVSVILSQVNCDGCDAPCCKSNPGGERTQIVPPEYKRLAAKYGDKVLPGDNGYGILPMPCPFLDKNNRCSIYPERPLVCVFYPWQPGGSNQNAEPMIALASGCPEARRLARSIYMTVWRMKQTFFSIADADPAFIQSFLKERSNSKKFVKR